MPGLGAVGARLWPGGARRRAAERWAVGAAAPQAFRTESGPPERERTERFLLIGVVTISISKPSNHLKHFDVIVICRRTFEP